MTFLPEEFAVAEERLRVLELPSYDAIPLIEFQGEVAMALDPLGVVWVGKVDIRVENRGLGTYTDTSLFLKLGE